MNLIGIACTLVIGIVVGAGIMGLIVMIGEEESER